MAPEASSEKVKKDAPNLEVITTHMNADFDALASMLAAKKLYPDAKMVFPGAQEKNLRNFFLHSTSYLFDFARIKDVDLSQIKRLILVDTRQKKRIGKFKQLLGKRGLEIHIYDHHPPSDDDITGDVEVIKEMGAGVSILADILREKGITITPDEATLMAMGIYEDTGSFTFSSTKAEDHEAAAWLLEQGASLNTISDMLTRELTAEQVWLLNDLMASATRNTINGLEVVITKAKRDRYIGDFAVLVQKLMEMENLNVLFALTQMENRVYLVARSRLPEVNVAEIAMDFGGGGHPQAASATITDKTLIQVEEDLNVFLRNRINFERLAKDMMTYPVITISPDASIKEAGDSLTRYNINVLMVLDDDGILKGYISRHVVDRAIFLGLETRPIKEYMSLEFNSVSPETSLNEIQELIITNNIRILPVMKDSQLLGVITRTDLLNILIERSSTPEFLYDTQDVASPLRMKNIRSLLRERLPAKIVTLLRELGAIADDLDFNAYLVGGVVRDVILKRKNLDLDIVTEGDAIKLAKTFARKKEARVKSYPKFGTAVVVMPDGFKIDIATARIEHYESPAAPPEVKLSSLKRDLYRRDFTINTLAVHLNKGHYGTLIDHFGAMKDIKERVLRVIHSLSFVEDPTRILRAIRFEQRFGFRIGKLTESLIHNAVNINSFENLSGQRFFAELKLILHEEDPVGAIERMDDFGLLKFISPDLKLTEQLRGSLERIKGILVWFDLLYLGIGYEPWKVYFMGLTASLSTDSFTKLVERMQIQDRDIVHAISTRQEVGKALREVSQLKDKKNYPLYELLSPFSAEILLCSMAKTKSDKIQKSISTFFSRLKGTKVLLKGKDLIAMGYEPGPLFKDIFDTILQARLEGAVSTREDEIQLLKERFGGRAQ
ncbi:MAG: CBS domain-containing protein [Deltaproteobacteria bacterium]|nr:MAG: CBS domain-containing protein [Deltaproteobacteria bacterium]